jgi:glycosyltransferase involved in cell wall biosynthesis
VVAFDVGSHKEIVKKGVLIKNRNIQAFADAIVSLLSKKNKK